MPAEFEPHTQTWMLWPERPDNWRLGAKPAQRAWVQVATAISEFEPVTVGANHDQYENARNMLPPGVRVVELSSNDAWIRDCGPTFVVNDEVDVRLVDWEFNAWGGLYDGLYFPWDKDQMVPRKIAELERVGRYRAPLVIEGGSFHVDGEGTVITTEECLLSRGRNPHLSREEIGAHLRDYLNVDQVIWLPRGIDPDETNGHVDDVACFVAPGAVLAGVTDDRDDWRFEPLRDNLRVLQEATDARGRRLRVQTLPMPAITVFTEEEAAGVDSCRRLDPASRRRRNGRFLPQLPDRQWWRHHADLRRPQRRRGRGEAGSRLPRPQGGDRAGTRDPARRRQCALHNPAATCWLRRCRRLSAFLVPRTEASMSVAARTSTGPVSLADQPRTMGIFSMTLFAVSAIITLDTVAVACALGVECITLYVIFAFLFFVPYGLVTAELGSGWPQEGGIYVWVREAFGQRWGTFTAWLYWVNVAYWAPRSSSCSPARCRLRSGAV